MVARPVVSTRSHWCPGRGPGVVRLAELGAGLEDAGAVVEVLHLGGLVAAAHHQVQVAVIVHIERCDLVGVVHLAPWYWPHVRRLLPASALSYQVGASSSAMGAGVTPEKWPSLAGSESPRYRTLGAPFSAVTMSGTPSPLKSATAMSSVVSLFSCEG